MRESSSWSGRGRRDGYGVDGVEEGGKRCKCLFENDREERRVNGVGERRRGGRGEGRRRGRRMMKMW